MDEIIGEKSRTVGWLIRITMKGNIVEGVSKGVAMEYVSLVHRRSDGYEKPFLFELPVMGLNRETIW